MAGRWWGAALTHGAVFTQCLCGFYVVSKYGAFFSKISGPSMFPTFTGQGDVVLAEAVSWWRGKICAGDVVICTRPVNPKETIIKRVAAVENEFVILYPDREHADVRRVQVPKGHIWLAGDNPTHSLDSRQYGAVPLALVKGRVLVQVWPKLKMVA